MFAHYYAVCAGGPGLAFGGVVTGQPGPSILQTCVPASHATSSLQATPCFTEQLRYASALGFRLRTARKHPVAQTAISGKSRAHRHSASPLNSNECADNLDLSNRPRQRAQPKARPAIKP